MRDTKNSMIRNHYIEQLNKLGVRHIDGQQLHELADRILCKALAVQRAIRE